MSQILSSTPNKPDSIDIASKYGVSINTKDNSAEYHIDYAKWAITNASTHQHHDWLKRTRINKRFYKGDQWFEKEDTEAFLKDDTGQERNRIQVVNNQIRPLIEQFRGNAIRLRVNASCKSISKKAVNRRETALAEQIFKTNVANEFPNIGGVVRQNDQTIGDTPGETTQIFENLYVDKYTEKMNQLLRYVGKLNEFDQMQTMAAQNLGLAGLVCSEAFEHGGHQRYELFEPEDFIFDHGARRYDLSDGMYMGRLRPLTASYIYERYQGISLDDRKAIENFVSNEHSHTNVDYSYGRNVVNTGRVPAYSMYWKDTEKFTYGWVLDEAGYPYLTRIDFVEEGETEAKYTKEDLIEPPNTRKNRNLFKNGKTRDMYVQVLRFCDFIPGELISNRKKDQTNEFNDIILDYGRAPHQEQDYLSLGDIKFPFKAYAWGYVDGEIFSPVDDAINPQRFINRVLSVAESQINNSGGVNVVLDEDTLPNQDPSAAYHDIAQGKPVTIRTKGRGIPNSIGNYDASPKAGTYKLFDIIPVMQQIIQSSTGVNEALKGEAIGQDQLVGVTNSLIQRGSLMQEPFYNAISRLFVQMYQHTATVGKRLYIENERELAISTGDDGVEILTLSEDMANEDFRAFVQRDNSDEILQGQANQMLTLFLELGMIDKNIFGDLYDRSTPDEVTAALRKSLNLQAEADRRASKAAQQQAAQEAQAQEAAVQQQRQDVQFAQGLQRTKELQDQQHDMDKIFAKGIVDVSKERAKGGVAA